MAVRIYALAKELKLDSKDLVDICTRAGIPGKGSALASLTESEVEKVKQFLDGGSKPAKPKSSGAAPAMERPKAPASGEDRLKVIVTPKAATPLEAVKASRQATIGGAEAAEAAEAAAETPDAETSPADAASAEIAPADAASGEAAATPSTGTEPPSPEGAGPLAGMLRREDYIGPGSAAAGKPPVVGQSSKSKPKKNEGGAGGRARPAIKLAPMPAPSDAPKVRKKPAEDLPAQKPDMKLPADVLGAGKAGSKPLAAHMARAERSLDAEKGARPAASSAATTPNPKHAAAAKGVARLAKKVARCWAAASNGN